MIPADLTLFQDSINPSDEVNSPNKIKNHVNLKTYTKNESSHHVNINPARDEGPSSGMEVEFESPLIYNTEIKQLRVICDQHNSFSCVRAGNKVLNQESLQFKLKQQESETTNATTGSTGFESDLDDSPKIKKKVKFSLDSPSTGSDTQGTATSEISEHDFQAKRSLSAIIDHKKNPLKPYLENEKIPQQRKGPRSICEKDFHVILLVPFGVQGPKRNDKRRPQVIHTKYGINTKNTGVVRGTYLSRSQKSSECETSKALSAFCEKLETTAYNKEHLKSGMLKKTTVVFGLNAPRSINEKKTRKLENELNASLDRKSDVDCKILSFFWEYPWAERVKLSQEKFKNLRQKQDDEVWKKFNEEIKEDQNLRKMCIAHEERIPKKSLRNMIPYGQILDMIKDSKEVQDTEKAIKSKNPNAVIIYCIGHAETLDFNQTLSRCIDKILKSQSRDSQVFSFGYTYPDKPEEENEEQHRIHLASIIDQIIRMLTNAVLPGGVYFPEPGLCFILGKEHKTIPNFSTRAKRGSGESPRFIQNLNPKNFHYDASFPICIKTRPRVEEQNFENLQIPQSHLKPLYYAINLYTNGALNVTRSKRKNLDKKRRSIISKIMGKYFSVFDTVLDITVSDHSKEPIYYLKRLQAIEPTRNEIRDLIRFTGFNVAPKILKAIYNSALGSLLYLLVDKYDRSGPSRLTKKQGLGQALQNFYEHITAKSSERINEDYNSFREAHHQKIQAKFNKVKGAIVGGAQKEWYSLFERILAHDEFKEIQQTIWEISDLVNLNPRFAWSLTRQYDEDWEAFIGLLKNEPKDVVTMFKRIIRKKPLNPKINYRD